jgi:hypothetical protein
MDSINSGVKVPMLSTSAEEIEVISKGRSSSKAEPQNLRDASEAVFKCFHLLNSITPFADPKVVIYSSNFALDFLDLVFSVVPDDAEDQVIGMIFENGPSVINNAQDDVINFSGNALVFSASGITAVTCLESIFEGQVHYSWAEVGSNNWTFYRRRFGENSFLISFGDGAAGQNFPGCKFDLRKYQGELSLNDIFTHAENALAKVMTLNGFQYEANETAQALGYTVKPEIGLSAQEVQAVLPEVVVPAPIDAQYLTVHYERVIPLLVEAIKELKKEVDELKK